MRTLLSHHAATMLATQQGETAYDLAVLHSHALAAAILARADPRLVKHTRLRCVIEVSNRPDPESAFDSTPTRVPTAVSSSIQSASTIASNPIAASGLGILTGLVRGRSATAPSTTTATTNDGEFLELDPTGHSPRPHLWTSLEAVPALPNWAWVTDWRLLDSQWAQVPAAASPTTIEAARPHNIDDAAAAGYSASMPDPSSLAWSAGARRGQRTMAGGSYMDRQASLSVIDHGQTAIAAVMGGGSDALEHPSPPAAHSPLHASRHHHTDESGDHPHSVALAMGVGQPGQYVRAWARVMRKIAPSPVPAHGLLGQMAESSLAASHPQEQQESAAPSTTSMTEQPAVPPSADLDYLDRAVAILDRSDPAYADISDFELYQVAIQCLLAGAQGTLSSFYL
ncbi:hypothetical protein BC828DRAFT_270208 [Blastocladiella britannica]|nr:hypothetical protein BC828DRAFT_270208 [Blastocladiella britannica]